MIGRAMRIGFSASATALLVLMVVASCDTVENEGDQEGAKVDESHLRVVTDRNFTELSSGEKPLVVDFWATWCPPCRKMGPVYAGVAKELGQKAVFGKLDVDKSKKTAGQVGVSGIPCIVVFRGGEEVARSVGLKSRDALKSFLEKTLAKAN